jgi:flagellar biogenesis protein FliO
VSPVASYVVQSVVTLAGVAALAVLLLYGARKTGIGRASGPIELVGRLPLDGRRAVYLVKVESTTYVVGSSEAGLVKLGELVSAGSGDVPATVVGKARSNPPPDREDGGVT